MEGSSSAETLQAIHLAISFCCPIETFDPICDGSQIMLDLAIPRLDRSLVQLQLLERTRMLNCEGWEREF